MKGLSPILMPSSRASRRASPRSASWSSWETSIARTCIPSTSPAFEPKECVWVVVYITRSSNFVFGWSFIYKDRAATIAARTESDAEVFVVGQLRGLQLRR